MVGFLYRVAVFVCMSLGEDFGGVEEQVRPFLPYVAVALLVLLALFFFEVSKPLSPATEQFSVRVVDLQGKPLPSSVVRVFNGTLSFEKASNASGEAFFYKFFAGTAFVSAAADGFGYQRKAVDVSNVKEVEFRLERMPAGSLLPDPVVSTSPAAGLSELGSECVRNESAKCKSVKLARMLYSSGVKFNPADLDYYANKTEVSVVVHYSLDSVKGFAGPVAGEVERIRLAAERHGGRVSQAFSFAPAVAVTLPTGGVQAFSAGLASFNKELDGVAKAFLDQAAPMVRILPQGRQARDFAGLDGTGVKIAILDTGIDESHPDLDDFDDNPSTNDSKVVLKKNFVDFSADSPASGDVYDGNGHGTHVASIAAGTGAASGGRFKGVAPNASLMIARVLDSGGSGQHAWIAEGIRWAADNNADVISMSLGGGESLLLKRAVDYALSKGVAVIAAAGNDGPGILTTSWPANFDGVVAVGSVDKDGFTSDFSSEGPSSKLTVKPDVAAPGELICAARPRAPNINYRPASCGSDYYGALSGTSMATPVVAGVFALVKQSKRLSSLNTTNLLVSHALPAYMPAVSEGSGLSQAFLSAVGETMVVPTSFTVIRDSSPSAAYNFSKTVTLYNTGGAEKVFRASLRLSVRESDVMRFDFPAEVRVPAGGLASFDFKTVFGETVGNVRRGVYFGRLDLQAGQESVGLPFIVVVTFPAVNLYNSETNSVAVLVSSLNTPNRIVAEVGGGQR